MACGLILSGMVINMNEARLITMVQIEQFLRVAVPGAGNSTLSDCISSPFQKDVGLLSIGSIHCFLPSLMDFGQMILQLGTVQNP